MAILGGRNLVNGTVTVSSSKAGSPGTNLLTPNLFEKWQTDTPEETVITVEMLTPRRANLMALLDNNMSIGSAAKISFDGYGPVTHEAFSFDWVEAEWVLVADEGNTGSYQFNSAQGFAFTGWSGVMRAASAFFTPLAGLSYGQIITGDPIFTDQKSHPLQSVPDLIINGGAGSGGNTEHWLNSEFGVHLLNYTGTITRWRIRERVLVSNGLEQPFPSLDIGTISENWLSHLTQSELDSIKRHAYFRFPASATAEFLCIHIQDTVPSLYAGGIYLGEAASFCMDKGSNAGPVDGTKITSTEKGLDIIKPGATRREANFKWAAISDESVYANVWPILARAGLRETLFFVENDQVTDARRTLSAFPCRLTKANSINIKGHGNHNIQFKLREVIL